MSTHILCFYGKLTKIILQLSSKTLLICSSGHVSVFDDPDVAAELVELHQKFVFVQTDKRVWMGWGGVSYLTRHLTILWLFENYII